MGVLEAIGVLDDVRARFLVKRGARFVDGARRAHGQPATPSRRRSTPAGTTPSRSRATTFDELLFRRAGACGAELREGWSVDARPSRRRARDRRGGARPGRRDARARGALRRRRHRPRRDDGPRRARHRAHLRGSTGRPSSRRCAARGATRESARGTSKSSSSATTLAARLVLAHPLRRRADERRRGRLERVGARARERRARRRCSTRPSRESPTASRMLDGRDAALRAARDEPTSASASRRVRGQGWLAVGDAAGFIDPLFSTGAHSR